MCTLPGLEVERALDVGTLYGLPSDKVLVGRYGEGRIAFIPRHAVGHTILPHKVPYKANLAALKSLGVRQVFATCVAGSLRKEIEPGCFVIPDQFIDRTWGRDDTSAIDTAVRHLPMAEPYCANLSKALGRAAQGYGCRCHEGGTTVVIQGPRFSTIAESRVYSSWGGDIINMTQYPECYFARELGLCYAAIASITDYDVGVSRELSIESGSFDKILPIFRKNTERTRAMLMRVMSMEAEFGSCQCAVENTKHYYEN